MIDAAHNAVRFEVSFHLLDQDLLDRGCHAHFENDLRLHNLEDLAFLNEQQGGHVDELRAVVREEDTLAHLVLPKGLHVLEDELL